MQTKAKLITPAELAGSDASAPIWGDYTRHYLAEGDSWFTLAALPGGNLLQELKLEQTSLIVTTAYPGDTLTHMVEWRQNTAFVNLLSRPLFAWRWDAILLSAGGNDLIDAALAAPGILAAPATPSTHADDYIDTEGYAKFEAYLRRNFEALVTLRDDAVSPNRGIPIILHTYDFPTPRPAPARLAGTVGALGPWLYTAFTEHNVPPELWQALADALLKRLAGILTSLHLPNIHVVDTLGTLDRAAAGSTGDSGDWLNEIHPNLNGRRKLAEKWGSVLDAL